MPALANSAVIIGLYLAAASLLWGVADATMDQPRDLQAFDEAPADAPRWRVAHLSDVHVVGEQYGFRIESGRLGPRGNERLGRVLDRLDAIHASDPLDFVLITGDMTDAGRSSEWAAFLDLVSRHPALAQRTFILPGNHDVNIVDRNNPARLELPMSPGKRLRQMRALSAMDAVQGTASTSSTMRASNWAACFPRRWTPTVDPSGSSPTPERRVCRGRWRISGRTCFRWSPSRRAMTGWG